MRPQKWVFSHLELMATSLSSEIQLGGEEQELGEAWEGAELQELALLLPSAPAFILENGLGDGPGEVLTAQLQLFRGFFGGFFF